MKPTKKNVCVFIEDEVQLDQARELLVKCNQVIATPTFYIGSGKSMNYLNYSTVLNNWGIGFERQNVITLTELEQILKDGKEN